MKILLANTTQFYKLEKEFMIKLNVNHRTVHQEKYYGNLFHLEEFTSHLCHKHNIIPNILLIIRP
jgi:hypothetical protein